MKTRVNHQVSVGLLLLALFIVAFLAGQGEAGVRGQATANNAFELDAGLNVSINRERLQSLRALASVVESAVDVPIRIELSVEQSDSAPLDLPEPRKTPAQDD